MMMIIIIDITFKQLWSNNTFNNVENPNCMLCLYEQRKYINESEKDGLLRVQQNDLFYCSHTET